MTPKVGNSSSPRHRLVYGTDLVFGLSLASLVARWPDMEFKPFGLFVEERVLESCLSCPSSSIFLSQQGVAFG